MKLKILIIGFCTFLVFFQSCVDHSLPEQVIDECDGTIVSYVGQIKPIIDTSCALPTCHNGDNGADRNWNILSNLQAKKGNVKDRVNRPLGEPGHMPPGGTLSSAEIQSISCWVDQGAPNN